MKELLIKAWFLLSHRSFLILLFIINFLGTLYGYYWYIPQLEVTEPMYYIFVPDSPTASLFFCIVIVGWLVGKHFKIMEALAVITLIKYGVWAVVMNFLTFADFGYTTGYGWMLIISHGLMAVQAVLYLPKYQFTYVSVAIAAVWTLHNDIIDYLFGQMPTYNIINDYPAQIGYFTFWLSVACIGYALFVAKRNHCGVREYKIK